METQKAVTPREIAEKIQDYDLALTVEASLADAVNKHIQEEKVFTPMQLVKAKQDFRKNLFLETASQTDFTWKQTSYLLENILNCWKHTGSPEKILEYPEYSTEEVKQVLQILKKREIPYSRIEDFEIDTENVAVLKEYQFTAIDRKILPDQYDSIPAFKDEKTSLPEFKIFSSASEIAQSIRENLAELEAEKVGIAVKPGTKYEPLVKSVLEAENIPYQRRNHLKEDEDLRTFISILEAGLSSGNVRVHDVRPIIDQLDISISRKHQNRKLEEVNEGKEFKEFLNAVEYLDFGDALQEYHEMTGNKTGIMDVLEEVGISEEKVSERRVNSLKYYLDSFDVTAREQDEGVILADPTKVSQIDREHVFHLGMDTDWMRDIGDRKWVDREEEEIKHFRDFKSLIQSGSSYYLVQEQELNEKIMPCFYLNQLTSQEFTSFSELPHSYVRPEETPEKKGFEVENYNCSRKKVEMVSQSDLNSFVQSPRLYYMENLVSDADQQRFEKGNLFHMYAEYHANNPGTASDIAIDELVELMLDEIEEFAEDLELEDLETQFRIGLKNIRSFLEGQALEKVSFDDYITTSDENIFVQNFPGGNGSQETEAYFKDRDLGAKGKIDLLLGENHLVDYKSGRRHSVQKVLKKSHPELFENEKFPDFQPLLYITEHRKHVDGKIKFTFLHFLNELGNAVNGEEAEIRTTITYHPETFQEKKSSMEIFEYMIKNVAKSNDRRKTLEKLGYQQYKNFMENRELPEKFDKGKLLETEFAQDLEEYAKQEVGDYKYVEKGVEKALKKLVDFRMENYFKEDGDRMEEFLKEKIREINEYLDSRFPVNADMDELPRRDLMLREGSV